MGGAAAGSAGAAAAGLLDEVSSPPPHDLGGRKLENKGFKLKALLSFIAIKL